MISSRVVYQPGSVFFDGLRGENFPIAKRPGIIPTRVYCDEEKTR